MWRVIIIRIITLDYFMQTGWGWDILNGMDKTLSSCVASSAGTIQNKAIIYLLR